MIYSRWRPDKGGYDYFEGNDRAVPLADDLPVPSLPRGTAIGVASIDVGRPIPPGATHVGSGAVYVGLMAPAAKSALHGLSDMVSPNYLYMAAGVFLGWLVFTKKVKLPW